MSTNTNGIIVKRYKGRKFESDWDGNILVNAVNRITPVAIALANPNVPVFFITNRNNPELIKGKNTNAINDSAIGFRLKLNNSPLEIGKANM